MNQDLPSNSLKSRREIKEKPEIKKVISGTVQSRKKSVGRKFKDIFFGTDAGSVGEYIINDVIIPAVQYTLVDSVKRGIEMLVFGSASAPDRSRSYSRILGGNYDYNSISTRTRREDPVNKRRIQINKYHGGLDDDELIFGSMADAKEVWSWLINLAEDYDKVSVADYYQLIGHEPDSSDFNYGWYIDDIQNIDVRKIILPVREGYLLDLPRTEYIGR